MHIDLKKTLRMIEKQLPVNVGLLIALGIFHALLVDLAQQHLGKTFVHLVQQVFQTFGRFRAEICFPQFLCIHRTEIPGTGRL